MALPSHLYPIPDRFSGLGGSEVSALIGMNPWLSSFDVYVAKAEGFDRGLSTDRTRWGRRLEKLIAEGYAEDRGVRVQWIDRTFQNLDRTWQILTPDFILIDQPRGGDAKCVAADQAWKWGDAGTDAAPDSYVVQCQWYLDATGFEAWDIAALFGGNKLAIYTIVPDRQIIDVLLEEAGRFWRENVIARVPPTAGATAATREYIRRRFPSSLADMRMAGRDELELCLQYKAACAEFAEAERRRDSLKHEIQLQIQDAQGLYFPSGGRVTWKEHGPVTVQSFTRPAGRRFDFRMKG